MSTEITVPIGIEKLSNMMCGCGCNELAWRAILAALERAASDGKRSPLPDDGHVWMLHYVLDYAKLTEHGSNIQWAWITDEGRGVLDFLRQYGEDWKDSKEIEFLASDGCVLSNI